MARDFSKLSVLVVEDITPMRDVIVTALELLGVKHIYTAADGEEGYSKYLKHDPDLIITDWLMEPVDGLEMVRWIRTNKMSHSRTVPIIVTTGYSASHRVVEARDKGITEFLAKPFTAAQLCGRITHIIDKPRDFIEADEYVGPDRRRKASSDENGDYNGPERRVNNAEEVWEI